MVVCFVRRQYMYTTFHTFIYHGAAHGNNRLAGDGKRAERVGTGKKNKKTGKMLIGTTGKRQLARFVDRSSGWGWVEGPGRFLSHTGGTYRVWQIIPLLRDVTRELY